MEQKNATEGGRIKVQNTPAPWTVSIISTGAVEITGGTIYNYQKPGLGEGLQDMFVMAGTDFSILGSGLLSSATGIFEGYIYCRDQFNLGGNSVMKGSILAKDDEESPTNEFDGLISENKIFGNFSIDFTSNIKFNLPGPVQILSWREIEVIKDPS